MVEHVPSIRDPGFDLQYLREKIKEEEREGEGKEKKERKQRKEGGRKSELKTGKGYRTVLTKAVTMWPCTVC